MTYALPKEARTKKLNSLSGDMRKVAEELISKKFGIEEEVLVNYQDVFLDPRRDYHQEYPDGRSAFTDDPHSVGGGPGMGEVGPIQVDYDPRSNLRSARVMIQHPSFGNLLAALRTIQNNNIRSRQPMEFMMSPDFYRYLMNDKEFHMKEVVVLGKVTQVLGCNVRITPVIRHAMLEAIF